jgi:ADP-ribosylglycohydrolase
MQYFGNNNLMVNYIIGAVAGDVIGSIYEWHNVKTVDFELFTRKSTFTDDSVLTFATMDCILNNNDYTKIYQKYGKDNPHRGYGGSFQNWIYSDNPEPYNSWGNGSAMRVSPVGWAFNTIEEVLNQAKASAEVTHNHPEGIKGAQAVASAIFMARNNKTKDEIKKYISETFDYDLDRTIAGIRPDYQFDVSCQGSVPEGIIAFLESTDYENAVRLAISLGGDSDTIACITGGIAEAFYNNIPENIVQNVLKRIPDNLIKLLEKFSLKYKKK